MAKNTNIRSNDRVITLVPLGNAKNGSGLIDPRLFKGGNRLRAIMDESGLWFLRLDSGTLHEDLKQRFTTFPRALEAVKKHFNKRNVDVKEVID